MTNKIFPYRLDQIKGRIAYEDIKISKSCGKLWDINSPSLKLGQLKLLMSEIMFLTKVSNPGDTVVYVGAAEGYHISMLADMFEQLNFELWDARKFDVKEQKNIKIFNNFFFDKDAKTYAKRENLLFICDIRNLDIRKAKKNSTNNKKIYEHDSAVTQFDEIVENDMMKQLRWIQIIKPKYAFIKFRFAYSPGVTKYLTGKIYLQAYSPLSTEARLLTNNYDTMINYDNEENDEKMAYFNCIFRSAVYEDQQWFNVMKKYNIRSNWDNNISFYILSKYLNKKYNKLPSDEDVANLFINIINYMYKKYGTKYNSVYNEAV